MNVTTIGQSQTAILNNPNTALNNVNTEMNTENQIASAENANDSLAKVNKDTFIRSYNVSTSTKSYSKSDLNSKYVSYTGVELHSQLQTVNTYLQHATGSDVYKYATEANNLSKELSVRNSLGYTIDLSGAINGKLKTMQEKTYYDYYQGDPKWGFGNNGQVACAATACAAMLSLYKGYEIRPDNKTAIPTDFNGIITSWPSTVTEPDRYASNKDINTYMNAIKTELRNGKPCEIHVGNHWVTVVGIKEGVSLSNAKLSDLYIFDPGTKDQKKQLCTMSASTDYRVVRVK